MVREVVAFSHSEKVKDIYTKLRMCTHNGFPVLNEKKRVIGLISRNHLVTILKNKFFKIRMATSPRMYEHHARTHCDSINEDSFLMDMRVSGTRRQSDF